MPARLRAQSATAPPGPTVALVDTRVLVESVPEARLADSVLGAELAVITRIADAVRDSAEARLAGLTRQAMARPAARAALARRADSIGAVARARIAALEARANARREAITAPFMEAMRAAVEAERASAGIQLVLDIASGAPVLAADEAVDITGRVVARLRAIRVAWPRTPAVEDSPPLPSNRLPP